MASYCSSCGKNRVKCARCKGKGTIYGGFGVGEKQCPACKGKGEVCPKCGN